MTPNEQLRHLRTLSGHSAAWCAENVGYVSLRSWQYWEAGSKNGHPVNVPHDVMETMAKLANAVQTSLRPAIQQQAHV